MSRPWTMCLLALLALPAAGQSFPTKPIRVVVPFPPGGVDTPMRLIGVRMQEDLGQPIVIENRAGANGVIGSEFVARAAPDGHTLLWTTSSTLVTAVFLSRNLPFDPVKDFAPLTVVYAGVETLAVTPSLPVRTVSELIAYARRNPGKLSFGSSGIGSAYHLDGELINLAGGIDMVHVPYKGTGPVLQELVGGRINVAVLGYSNARPLVNTGKVRVIALIDPRRYTQLPDVPTVAETLPNFVKAPSWIGMVAPSGLARPLQMRLYESISKASKAPEPAKYFEDGGSLVILNTPDEFAALLRRDLEMTGKAVKAMGIVPE